MKVANFSDLDLTKEYTVADYLTWWFEERVELIKGKIHPLIPTPRDIHQEVSINLSTEINIFDTLLKSTNNFFCAFACFFIFI